MRKQGSDAPQVSQANTVFPVEFDPGRPSQQEDNEKELLKRSERMTRKQQQ